MTEPMTALPGEPAGGSPGQRRLLVALAGALVLIILVIVGFAVLSDGGDEEADPTTTVPGQRREAVTTSTTVAPRPGSAETFEVFATKNPFLPLRGASAAGAGAGAGGGVSGAAGSATVGRGAGGGGAATGATTGTSGASAARGAGAGGSAEPRRGARVALLDVFVEGGRTVANVRVNDTVHKVGPGQVFATNFKVVSLSQADGCGRFLFGDDSFRLCKGEETLK